MSGLLSSATAILRYASNVQEDGVAKGTLKTLEDSKMALINADGSMLKLLGKYIVEPIAVVSEDLKDVEELDHILGLHMDMFTGYYMQVFDILRNQYGLSITTVVDTLSTDNGGLTRVLVKGLDAGVELSNESDDIKDYLGELLKLSSAVVTDLGVITTEKNEHNRGDTRSHNYDDNYRVDREPHTQSKLAKNNVMHSISNSSSLKNKIETTIAMDRIKQNIKDRHDHDKLEQLKKTPGNKRIFATNKNIEVNPTKLSDAHKDLLIPNAIQRTIEIKVEAAMPEPGSDGVFHTKTIVVPVTIKLGVIFSSTENIINAISTKSAEYGFSERLDSYRAGAISLTDFVFASDLIRKYKKHKLKDKTDLLKIIDFRELSGNSKLVTNGFAGFEKFYNMYIISPDAKNAIEREVRSKLASKGKDKFLEAGNGLSVTVVDPDYERIRIMFKDIRGKSDLSIKNAVKKDKNGSDYSEIVKALIANKPPAF